MRAIVILHVMFATVGLIACGSDSPGKMDAPVQMDTKKVDAAIDAPATPMLTVKNYISWCSVTVGSGSASISGVQTVPITASGPITLKASPKDSGFEDSGNMWHHTDGDTGAGETGTVVGSGVSAVSTATVTVTMGASKCVWVCCPFAGGAGCTGIAEQCN